MGKESKEFFQEMLKLLPSTYNSSIYESMLTQKSFF